MSEYKVGYKSPPLHTRFKKGICPNPKGRGASKESSGLTLLRKVLDEVIEYSEGGVRKRATTFEVMVTRMAADAMKGDIPAARQLFGLKKHFQEHGDIQPLIIYMDKVDMAV